MTLESSCYIINPSGDAGLPSSGRALFLDRDGVINVNFGYVHTPDRTAWVPGIFELCSSAIQAGYGLVVVTNQAGIARGLYTEAQFAVYTDWMLMQFRERGIDILRVYYCPHHPTAGEGKYRMACECRKPGPGMMRAAAQDFGIDLAASVMIGDKGSDMQAARAAGIGTRILLEDGQDAVPLEDAGAMKVGMLSEARDMLVAIR